MGNTALLSRKTTHSSTPDELGSILMGTPNNTLDTPVAREIARRMCGAYAVQARSTRRLPTP